MGKTIEQVARHLILRGYREDEWETIRNDFKERFGKMPKKSVKPKSMETLQDFWEWLDCGFADGDIVRMGDYIGILADRGDRYALAAIREGKGPIAVVDKYVDDELEAVTDEVAESFRKRLRMDGYDFRVSMSAVVPRVIVPAYTRVSYGDKCGIIGGYGEGTVTMLVEVEGNDMRLGVEYPVFNIDFRNAKALEIRRMDRVMVSHGLRYDAASRTLREAVSRVSKGEKFWYINENFGVSTAIERGTRKQDLRYRNGNYFLTISDALDFQKRLKELVDGYEKRAGK